MATRPPFPDRDLRLAQRFLELIRRYVQGPPPQFPVLFSADSLQVLLDRLDAELRAAQRGGRDLEELLTSWEEHVAGLRRAVLERTTQVRDGDRLFLRTHEGGTYEALKEKCPPGPPDG